MPSALAQCLQDTLFFSYEILYFRFAKLRWGRARSRWWPWCSHSVTRLARSGYCAGLAGCDWRAWKTGPNLPHRLIRQRDARGSPFSSLLGKMYIRQAIRNVQGTPITERPPQLGRIEARTGLRMMPTSPRSPYHSVQRVFPSTAGRLAFPAVPSQRVAQFKPAPGRLWVGC
jgi:hypothetical protein